jgi:hypothetical protein
MLNTTQAAELLQKKVESFAENNDEYLKFLEYKAQQYDYSWQNTLLIWAQSMERTGELSRVVRGAKQWEKMGRTLKDSQDQIVGPIYIRAPRMGKYVDEDGVERKKMFGWLIVTVYDIRDTEGPEYEDKIEFWSFLPEGDDAEENLASLMYNVVKEGWPVEVKPLPDRYGGYYRIQDKDIFINAKKPVNSQFMTLIHETVHAMIERRGYKYDTQQHEIVAQSVAYIVTNHLGIDTEKFSLGYLTTWIKNDAKRFEKALKHISDLSTSVINLL